MRTLEINKTTLWCVNPNGVEVEIIDEDGYNTGVVERMFGVPQNIKLHLYPATRDVVDREFGKNVDIDMVTSTNIVLEKNSLIFHEFPIGDIETTFDYKVTHILPSLNSYQYGLRGRR